MIDGWGVLYEIVLRWISMNLTDYKSTPFQVMAWCRQATSHYLSQCWPGSMSQCGVIRPQWVNGFFNNWLKPILRACNEINIVPSMLLNQKIVVLIYVAQARWIDVTKARHNDHIPLLTWVIDRAILLIKRITRLIILKMAHNVQNYQRYD